MEIRISEPLLEMSDAARVLGLSVATVRTLAEAGRLVVAGRTVRGLRLFSRAAVDDLAREREAMKTDRGATL